MGRLRRFSNPFRIHWERSAPSTTDLRLKVKDAVFSYQTKGQDFVRINASSLVVAEVCGTQAFGEKVLAACERSGIVDALTGYPRTNKIDRNIVTEMPQISMPKQKELIMLLFFHEQEIMRYRILCAEEAEILDIMTRDGLNDADRVDGLNRIKDIESEKRVLPSRRHEQTAHGRGSIESGSSTGLFSPSLDYVRSAA